MRVQSSRLEINKSLKSLSLEAGAEENPTQVFSIVFSQDLLRFLTGDEVG